MEVPYKTIEAPPREKQTDIKNHVFAAACRSQRNARSSASPCVQKYAAVTYTTPNPTPTDSKLAPCTTLESMSDKVCFLRREISHSRRAPSSEQTRVISVEFIQATTNNFARVYTGNSTSCGGVPLWSLWDRLRRVRRRARGHSYRLRSNQRSRSPRGGSE